MKIYEHIPTRNYQKLTGIIVILISAAAGFFAFPLIFSDMPLRSLFQLTGIACLAAVVFIASRYIMKTLVYMLIENDEGGIDMTVTEVTNGGKSRITVCRFSLDNIESAENFSAVEKQKKKQAVAEAKKEHRKLFNYCPDPLSDPVCIIKVTECGEPLLIKIAPDAELQGYIAAAVQRNGENKKEEPSA